MNTKLVYVIVSSEKDIYLEQAYISMYSAKYYMPDTCITLLTDTITSSTFLGERKEKLKYVDELITIELDPKFNPQKRSRLLKTSVRNYVNGDYLFIDSDTIITKPLYEIDDFPYEIAASWDTHALFAENPYRNMCIEHGKILNWPIENEEIYFNSGIIYAKDTPKVREFYTIWNQYYIDGYNHGVTMDQPSFAKTNYKLEHIVQRLDDVWNCELKHGVKFLKDAKIVHYLTTNKPKNNKKQFFILNDINIYREIKESSHINKQIQRTINDPFYGLANITHCFAGEDVYFFQSKLYNLIYYHIYNSKYYNIISIILNFIANIRNKLIHYCSKSHC